MVVRFDERENYMGVGSVRAWKYGIENDNFEQAEM